MKRVLKGILTIAIVISTFANGVNYTMATSDSSIIYPVSEDSNKTSPVPIDDGLLFHVSDVSLQLTSSV